ncbi:hypothetical protein LINPERPRIM_LOCUS25420 [Linum perenne]
MSQVIWLTLGMASL